MLRSETGAQSVPVAMSVVSTRKSISITLKLFTNEYFSHRSDAQLQPGRIALQSFK